MQRQLDIASSLMTSALRAGTGVQASPAARKPAQPLVLYDIEGSPYCRLVREALTELDLDALIYPCPKRGTRFRPEAVALGG
ncbi:MAG: glutathione S-transferase N-terminal domain-containing protein, partial [Pseudomonadota bacterium]